MGCLVLIGEGDLHMFIGGIEVFDEGVCLYRGDEFLFVFVLYVVLYVFEKGGEWLEMLVDEVAVLLVFYDLLFEGGDGVLLLFLLA